METPDRWVLIRVNGTGIIKILAGWRGGYIGADHWRLSSMVVKAKEHKDFINFTTRTGNVYQCHKHNYGFTNLTSGIYERGNIKDVTTVIDDDDVTEIIEELQ